MSGITDFSKAKVGDRFFSRFIQQWGTITDIRQNTFLAKMDNNIQISFYINGRFHKYNVIQDAIWAEQKPEDDWSILPEMPKRMVKKKVDGWVNIIKNEIGHIYPGSIIHETIEKAKEHQAYHALGEPLFISYEYEEYEVEED